MRSIRNRCRSIELTIDNFERPNAVLRIPYLLPVCKVNGLDAIRSIHEKADRLFRVGNRSGKDGAATSIHSCCKRHSADDWRKHDFAPNHWTERLADASGHSCP